MHRRTFIRYAGSSLSVLFVPPVLTPFSMQNEPLFDVLIIGGSNAGLSAAMALGRARRQVLVVDAGEPCNRFTPRSHNFLTQDGVAPAAIVTIARAQVARYPTITLHDGFVRSAQVEDEVFQVELADGKRFRARRVLLATGLRDELPEVTGLADCWGKSVIHCPYCHGYEYADRPTGVLVNAPTIGHMADLLPQWSRDLHAFGVGAADLDAELRAKLEAKGIRMHEASIAECIHDAGELSAVRLTDGSSHAISALYVRPGFASLPPGLSALGAELTPMGLLQVDMMQRTTVSGLYAAGDVASPLRSVANAVAQGNMAGAAINMDLGSKGIYRQP